MVAPHCCIVPSGPRHSFPHRTRLLNGDDVVTKEKLRCPGGAWRGGSSRGAQPCGPVPAGRVEAARAPARVAGRGVALPAGALRRALGAALAFLVQLRHRLLNRVLQKSVQFSAPVLGPK